LFEIFRQQRSSNAKFCKEEERYPRWGKKWAGERRASVLMGPFVLTKQLAAQGA
jgi:hypothetical protein